MSATYIVIIYEGYPPYGKRTGKKTVAGWSQAAAAKGRASACLSFALALNTILGKRTHLSPFPLNRRCHSKISRTSGRYPSIQTFHGNTCAKALSSWAMGMTSVAFDRRKIPSLERASCRRAALQCTVQKMKCPPPPSPLPAPAANSATT